jgi:hypothetical protein
VDDPIELPVEVDGGEQRIHGNKLAPPMPQARAIAPPAALAAAIAAAHLMWGPASQDLAAATFRADLFADHGFALWNDDWYSGHYLLSYSVLYPPLGALLGARLTGALAVVAAAALFAELAGRRFGDAAMVPALWFAAAVASWLFTGRITFLLAVPLGLAALLPRRGAALVLAALLACLSSLASPVAGLFVAVAGVALALTGERARGAWLAIGAAVPIAALNLAFPVGGEEPFVFSAFVAVPILALAVIWLVPREHRALRVGVVLYTLLALVVFVVPNALGGNVTRLGALLAGPVMALVLWPRGRLVVVAVSIPLLYWQLIAPVRDVRKAAGDPATERAFFEPLVEKLDRLDGGRASFRTEIPPTRNRWEAAYVAPEHPIARGWLRQLEADDFDLFTDGELTPAAYRDWLRRHGVSYVAVPHATLDYLAEDEVALIDRGLTYLAPVWSNDDWRLYRVRGGGGLAKAGVRLEGPGGFTIDRPRAGAEALPLNWNRYWSIADGVACLREGDDGETVVEARGRAPVAVETRIGGSSCSG